jgi:hypothetical protein
MCYSTVLDHNIVLLAGLLGHEKCLVLHGLTKNVATLVGMTRTKLSMEQTLFPPCVPEFSAEIFTPPQFSDIVPEKKLCTAEEAI